MASIRVEHVTKRFGSTVALNNVSLEIEDGEFFAVLGPPGAGKTTLLRTIVGLEQPDEGDVYAGGERITAVYPGDRDIAIMFQNLALYPDKTVFNNLAFPLKQRKLPKDEIRRRVQQTAEILHISHLLDRKPGKLSGGERQRVALGRALVREPHAFLFDEPLSALDALLRLEMRAELKRLQRDLGRTLVYVTHDQVEAMSMPDRIAVLREGVVQQVDTPEDVYHRPANRFVATVVGSPPMNFLPCTIAVQNGALHVRHPLFEVDVLAREVAGADKLTEGAECLLGVRPEDVRVDAPGESSFAATVYVSEPLGGETVVDLQVGHLLVKALTPASVEVKQDAQVQVSLDPSRLHLFTSEGDSVLSAAGESLFSFRAPPS
jgi:multiple sugar transport system ATP-binding protein